MLVFVVGGMGVSASGPLSERWRALGLPPLPLPPPPPPSSAAADGGEGGPSSSAYAYPLSVVQRLRALSDVSSTFTSPAPPFHLLFTFASTHSHEHPQTTTHSDGVHALGTAAPAAAAATSLTSSPWSTSSTSPTVLRLQDLQEALQSDHRLSQWMPKLVPRRSTTSPHPPQPLPGSRTVP